MYRLSDLALKGILKVHRLVAEPTKVCVPFRAVAHESIMVKATGRRRHSSLFSELMLFLPPATERCKARPGISACGRFAAPRITLLDVRAIELC